MRSRTLTITSVLLVLLLLLTGCTNKETEQNGKPKGGTLYLTVNPVIAVTYDGDGRVTDVTAVSKDAAAIVDSYSSYAGKDCVQVVSELVEKIGQAGYLEKDAFIRVTFDERSGGADEIAEEIAGQIEQVVAESDWDATVEVELPEESQDTTAGSSMSETTKPDIPEGAEVYDDGTYSLKSYLGQLLTEVEQDRAVYVRTTVYTPDGSVLSQEIRHIETDIQYRVTINEYDGDVLVCSTVRQYDENGDFSEHYDEVFDSSGAVLKNVEYDRFGQIQRQTLYTYYASGQKSQVQTINGQGEIESEQNYFENGQLHADILFYDNGQYQSVTEYDDEGNTLHSTSYYDDGSTKGVDSYVDGVLQTAARYDRDGVRTSYIEYWENGQEKCVQTVGFYYNEELIKGLCIYTYTEEGVPVHDVLYWPDGTIFQEVYYYPSGNIKTQYIRDPSNSYNPEYYGEHRDGESGAYKGWNIIAGEKIYFNLEQ